MRTIQGVGNPVTDATAPVQVTPTATQSMNPNAVLFGVIGLSLFTAIRKKSVIPLAAGPLMYAGTLSGYSGTGASGKVLLALAAGSILIPWLRN
jgi:hypothetical protein